MNKIIDRESESLKSYFKRLGHSFKDISLLNRALTHRSYINEHPDDLEDNERLEFLGDAVLDFVVGAWLYNRYPEMPEGDLTRLRSALVYTEILAVFARKINLGEFIRLGRGEIHAGGKDKTALLCDAFEALVGAIYLDAGIERVWEFITPFLEDAVEDILENHKTEDPKSMLQEWVQAQGLPAPQYITRKTYGPDHSKVFEIDVAVNGRVMGNGSGYSKQLATKSAAQDALVKLGLKE